ncbi:hypothetical protein [Kitasatospora sp. NPDC098663]|uniref:hypothetical protein n=1 Tax=Kitasatospora sp. NPDC098663 TaxID=3364096 RepID=UPI003817C04E
MRCEHAGCEAGIEVSTQIWFEVNDNVDPVELRAFGMEADTFGVNCTAGHELSLADQNRVERALKTFEKTLNPLTSAADLDERDNEAWFQQIVDNLTQEREND